MSDSEIEQFVASNRMGTLATTNLEGKPTLTTIWYAVSDGDLWFEAATTSQLIFDLRRDPRASVLVKDGLTYDTLRGVALEGVAELVHDPETGSRIAAAIAARDPQEARRDAEATDNNVVVQLVADRTRSWDHRKLGLPVMPLSGTATGP